jgi:hypothetical protein
LSQQSLAIICWPECTGTSRSILCGISESSSYYAFLVAQKLTLEENTFRFGGIVERNEIINENDHSSE